MKESGGQETEQPSEDAVLVERAKAGDRSAFGELVELHQKRVYAVAYGILRNREDAWDVAQETFVKAYRHLGRFEGQASFYTWIYRIAYNLSIDHYRSKGRKAAVHFDDDAAMESAIKDHARPVSNANPVELSDREELSRVLNDAINRLSDKHRAIIVLREVEGLSYEEIADVLGVPKGTVMSRLFHARKNLQTILQPYVSEDAAEEGFHFSVAKEGT